MNDLAETQAIKAVFGNHAPQIAISSTKFMLGHMMGAAGVVEALICALVVQEGACRIKCANAHSAVAS